MCVTDVGASNVTLERAEAIQAIYSPRFPNARVLIEPQSGLQEVCLFPPEVQPRQEPG